MIRRNFLFPRHQETLTKKHGFRRYASLHKNTNFFQSTMLFLAEQGRHGEARSFFHHMNSLGIKSTKFILCSVLSSCSKAPNISLGLQLHATIIKLGNEGNAFLGSKLVDLYCKSALIDNAIRAFEAMEDKDEVSWTAMVSGLSQNNRGSEALSLLKEMMKNFIPSGHAFTSVISACKRLDSALQVGLSLHAQVLKLSFDLNNSFVVSSLIDFYSKHGEIEPAFSLFTFFPERDAILYNSMMSGFSQNMLGEETLELFLEMQERGLKATGFTLASLLNASGSLAMLHLGEMIHSLVLKHGWDGNLAISGALVDMYSKCGAILEAWRAFDFAPLKNSIMWTSLITGFAQNGRERDAVKMFERLLEEGGEVDRVCFTAVLTACNHGGLVDQGIHYFKLMKSQYGLVPEVDQFACMVDLYGRAGRLNEAKEMIEAVKDEQNAVLWSSFLSSCRTHGEMKMGEEAAWRLCEIDPNDSASYSILARAFALEGRWNEVAEVREMWREKGSKRSIGCSWIDLGDAVHSFLVGDRSHPACGEIHDTLDSMTIHMKEGLMITRHKQSRTLISGNEC
ncbi:pentatricopeptide repeat-containing protein At3g49170, chloroplastic-like [Wolffia australiana]